MCSYHIIIVILFIVYIMFSQIMHYRSTTYRIKVPGTHKKCTEVYKVIIMLRHAQRLAARAINERGVALYNSGDVAGCAREDANIIADILEEEATAGAGSLPAYARDVLSLGLQEAGRLAGDVDAQAWALRGTLDRLIECREPSVASNKPAMSSSGPGNDSRTCLLSFRDAMPIAFRALDDRVMGGSSCSQMRFSKDAAAAVFSGNLVLEGGGFASCRGEVDWDLRCARAIVVEAASGSGGSFKLRLQNTRRVDDVYHQAEFKVHGDGAFREYELPLDAFKATWRGMPQRKSLDIGGIRSFGFMISKFNDQGETENNLRTGRFELSVRGVLAAS